MDSLGGLLVIAFLVGFYFLPMLIAVRRNHHNYGSIAVINIFLGWTALGWIIALAMAVSAVRHPVTDRE